MLESSSSLAAPSTLRRSGEWIKQHHLIILLIMVAIRQAFVIGLVPIWHVPDETAHVQYSQTIVEERRFPVFGLPDADFSAELVRSYRTGSAGDPRYSQYVRFVNYRIRPELPARWSVGRQEPPRNPAALYGPVYYLYESIPYALFYNAPLETRVHAMRAGSSLLLLGVVWLSYRIAFLIRPKRSWAWLIAAAVGFHPTIGYMMAGVNADNFLMLATMASLYFAIRLVYHRQAKDLLWFGVGAGLAAMSKQPGWIFFPLVILAWWMNRSAWSRRDWLQYGGLAIVATIIIGASWSIRGFFVNTTNAASSDIVPVITEFGRFTMPWILKMDLTLRLPFVFISFWGFFGWIGAWSIYPMIVYKGLATLVVVTSVGLWKLIFSKGKQSIDALRERTIILGALILMAELEAGYQWLWWSRAMHNNSLRFTAHGRYYLFLIFLYILVIFVGLERLVPSRHRRLVWILVAGLIIILGGVAIWPALWNSGQLV